MTLYGTGARRTEVAHLKIGDIDSRRMVVHIHGGKGNRDRDVRNPQDSLRHPVPLPPLLQTPTAVNLLAALLHIESPALIARPRSPNTASPQPPAAIGPVQIA